MIGRILSREPCPTPPDHEVISESLSETRYPILTSTHCCHVWLALRDNQTASFICKAITSLSIVKEQGKFENRKLLLGGHV